MNENHYADLFVDAVNYMEQSDELTNSLFIAGVKLLSSQNGTPEQLASLVEAHNKLTRGNQSEKTRSKQ